jgi:hypothetical protein
VESIRRAIDADGRQAVFHSNLGEAHRALGEIDAACACFETAIRLAPNFSEAHNNLGLALQTKGDVAAAKRQFERALEIRSDNVEAHYNLSRVLLLTGDFERGWREYAWRLRMRGHPGQELALPPWDGSSLVGKRLLVYAEQGLGDTLQFVRYLSLVAPRAGEVQLLVGPQLVPLLSASGFHNLIPRGAPLPACDAAVSLLSLPGLLGTTVETIPAPVPYLQADPALVEHWRSRLATMSGCKVGIAWQGNASYYSDRFRSIPLAEYEPLAKLSDVRLISLQVGDAARQIDRLADRFEVTRFDDTFDVDRGPLMDTAAVMMHLDLVVTSDTAITHLAGALGVPVWLALSLSPEWRWLLNRGDSPWYPTMRLFRQSALGRWGDVFDSIAEAIRKRRSC